MMHFFVLDNIKLVCKYKNAIYTKLHGLITPRQPKYSRHSLVEKELTWCVSALTYNMQGI